MAKKSPLILVSNDDGFQSEGIRFLATALRRMGQVVVVAPDREQSASSHSLTLHRPLRVARHGAGIYSVDGTPTDCILLAVHEILRRKPNLIVSGINRGANLGNDVHYSGTVSAAVEGALIGVPSMAVSLVTWGEGRAHFGSAAAIVRKLCGRILGYNKERRFLLPEGSLLNVNVPNVSSRQLRGVQLTRLGKRDYGEVIFKKTDPRGKKYYWIGGDERTFQDIPGSDGNAILGKKISVTPLRVDLTDHSLLSRLADETL